MVKEIVKCFHAKIFEQIGQEPRPIWTDCRNDRWTDGPMDIPTGQLIDRLGSKVLSLNSIDSLNILSHFIQKMARKPKPLWTDRWTDGQTDGQID